MISVLYVDDEPVLLDICKIFLERSGKMKVETSISAVEALKRLSTESFDAIISDYQMPIMNGIDFLITIRKQDKYTPFIMFTGKGREEIAIDAFREGADFYLQKGGDPKSQFAELIHQIEQIGRLKKAESDIVKSERIYRTLFETAQDPIFLMDGDRIIDCNYRMEVIFSRERNDIIGKSPVDLSPVIQPDGNNSIDKVNSLIHLALDDHPQFFEWRHISADGKLFDAEVSLNRIEIKEQYLLLAIIRDITERKRILEELQQKNEELESSYEQLMSAEEELKYQYTALSNSERALHANEEKLRSTLASMDDLVLILDDKGVFLDSYKKNSECYYIPPEVFIGHHYRDVFSEDLADLLDKSLQRVIESGETDQITYSLEMSGHLRYYNAKISKRFDEDGNTAGVTLVARDITDQKIAENALSQSEQLYRNVIENIQDVYYRSDREGNLIMASPSIIRLLGYDSFEEILGKNIADTLYYNPEDRKQFLKELSQTGSVTAYEVTLRRKDGAPVYVSTSSHYYPDIQGQIAGVEGIFHDITEQKEVNKRLKRQEAILNAVIQESPVPMFVIDRNHRIMHWNLALAKYSGISPVEIVGTNQQWRAFYPQERPCLADLLVEGRTDELGSWYSHNYAPSKLIEGGYQAFDYFPHLGPEGRWLFFTAAPIRDDNGEIIGVVEILEDISEQKNAEAELRSVKQYLESIIMNANVWLMVLDKNTDVIIWNHAAEDISGYSAQEVIGSHWIWKVLYPNEQYRRKITGEIVRIISDNLFLYNFHTVIRSKDGNSKSILWNTRALRDEMGEITGYVAVGIEKT